MSSLLLALALVDLLPRCDGLTPLPAAEVEPGQAVPLVAGTPLGELQVRDEWRDFRGQPVGPGRYELRYALQPRLKDHLGVDAIRDFALLVPPGTRGSWLAASRQVSQTRHPAVMALLAGPGPAGWRTLACPEGPRFVLEGQAPPADGDAP